MNSSPATAVTTCYSIHTYLGAHTVSIAGLSEFSVKHSTLPNNRLYARNPLIQYVLRREGTARCLTPQGSVPQRHSQPQILRVVGSRNPVSHNYALCDLP